MTILARCFAATAMPAVVLLGSCVGVGAASTAGARAVRAHAVPVPRAGGCVNDVAAKATLYGRVPSSPGATGGPAIVRIFEDSPAVEAYLDIVTNSLAGRGTTPSPSELADPDGVTKRMATMTEIPNILANARTAQLRPDGYFVCRGFGAGRYVVLVDAYAFGTSNAPGAGKITSEVETFYRGSAEVGDVRRPVSIAFSMQMVGRNPP